MIHRNMYLKGLLAVAALIVSVTSVFAVTEADVVRLKDKVANGQALTEDEQHMAIKAEGLFGSQILQPQETLGYDKRSAKSSGRIPVCNS